METIVIYLIELLWRCSAILSRTGFKIQNGAYIVTGNPRAACSKIQLRLPETCFSVPQSGSWGINKPLLQLFFSRNTPLPLLPMDQELTASISHSRSTFPLLDHSLQKMAHVVQSGNILCFHKWASNSDFFEIVSDWQNLKMSITSVTREAGKGDLASQTL